MRHPHARWTSALLLSTLAATGIAFVGRGAEAQESKDVVTVQARILQNGVPVNADLDLTFEVYTASSGGTKLWSESQSAVPVRNGILAISLGTASALGSTFKNGFNATSERWLAVKQGGTEIVPRIRLTAVPYAQAAGTAEVASAIWNSSTSTSLTLSGLVGTGLEQDGTGKIRIAGSAAGNGLVGGSGSALAVGAANASITVTADAIAVNPAALINGGAVALDADRLRIDLTPTNYTPTTTGTAGLATATTDLTAHLKGIDNAITTGGSGTVVPQVAGGRLTVSATLPVTTIDTTSSTLYYLPYVGQLVALYSGSVWNYRNIGSSGVSISVTGLTADQVYDVFMYDNSGTPTLETLAWSNHGAGTGTRATGLVRQDGVLVKSGATTRRYLGTIRTISSTGVKATDSNAQRFVWNAQNQVQRASVQADATSNWSYNGGFAACNSNDPDWKHEFVRGLDDHVAIGQARMMIVSPAGGSGAVGIALNGTGTPTQGHETGTQGLISNVNAWYRGRPGEGYGYLQAVQAVTLGGSGAGFYASSGTNGGMYVIELN